MVVVGGLLHSGPQAGDARLHPPRGGRATVVGICTGVFTLMRAGVLDGYRTCVSWFHYWDFIERFPAADPDLLIADRLFVIDRRRITCSGGRASIDVAAAILLRHFDHATVQKALRILLVGEMQKGNAPQPHPPGLEPATREGQARDSPDGTACRACAVARRLASKLDLSTRQLERLFKGETGKRRRSRSRCGCARPRGC